MMATADAVSSAHGAPEDAAASKQVMKPGTTGLRLASLAIRNDRLSEKLKRVDANKDGVIDAEEVAAIIDEMVKEVHTKRIYKFMTIGLFIVVAVLIGALTGITYGIVQLSKDTKISNYNTTSFQFLTTRDGAAAVTGGASLNLADFRVLPVANISGSGRRMLQASGSNNTYSYYGTVGRATAVSGCNILANGIASFIVTKAQQQVDPVTGATRTSISTVSVLEQMGCSGGGSAPAISALIQANGADMKIVCDMGSDACDLFFVGTPTVTNTNVTDGDSAASPARRHLQGWWSPPCVARPNDGCKDHDTCDKWGVCCKTCYSGYRIGNCNCIKDSSECFPASALVCVLGRGAVPMDELQYGDLVLSRDRTSGALVHRPVYLFGHRDAARVLPYVHISAADRTLALSAGHFAPVCVEHCTPEALAGGKARVVYRYGGDIRVGDMVMVAEPLKFVAVEQVDVLHARGAFNPYVRGADLIVDGVVASPHSHWILDASAPAWLVPHLPSIYEVMFAPVYAIYLLVGPATGEWLAHGPHGLGLVDAGVESGAVYFLFLAGLALPAVLAAAGATVASKRLTTKRSC